jgi:hypothetical protein
MNDTATRGLREMVGDEVRVAFIDRGCPPSEARAVIYGELTDHPQEGPDGSTVFGLRDRQGGENIGRLVLFGDEQVSDRDHYDGAGLMVLFDGGAGIEVTIFG